MKRFKFKLTAFLAIALTLAPTLALALPVVDKQFIKGIELLENPGFENGLISWTQSGAGTVVKNTSTPLAQNISARFTATASGQTFSSKLYVVPAGAQGANCAASIRYKTAEATNKYILKAFDNSSNLLASTTLSPVTFATQIPITFICPSSGSIQLQIASTGSAVLIDLDSAHLGTNDDLGTASVNIAPTVQKLVSGSGIYNTPSGVTSIRIKMVGGGGGGSGSGAGASGGAGGNGGPTTFGTSLLTANGGAGGANNQNNSNGGAGGTTSVTAGPIVLISNTGSPGNTGTYSNANAASSGGMGGSSPFAGAGTNTIAALTNTGSGGGGAVAQPTAGVDSGNGGGSGGYIEAVIVSPASSYAYSIGTAGSAGTAGTSGSVGGAGGSGIIIVEENYTQLTQLAYRMDAGGLAAGDLLQTGATSCPIGTVKADGTAYSSTVYPALFSAIGYTYGGSAGTFNVPNAQGAFLRGAGSQTIASITYTGTQGTTQGDQMQGHYHQGYYYNNSAPGGGGGGVLLNGNNGTAATGMVGSAITDGTDGTPRVGNETRPANISVMTCIRTVAAAPSPVLVGGVTSNISGQLRAEFAQVATTCSASPCTITQQSGSWLTSISRSATGVYALNIASSEFSSTPVCTITTLGTNTFSAQDTTTANSVLIPFLTRTASTLTSTDTGFNVICMGAR